MSTAASIPEGEPVSSDEEVISVAEELIDPATEIRPFILDKTLPHSDKDMDFRPVDIPREEEVAVPKVSSVVAPADTSKSLVSPIQTPASDAESQAPQTDPATAAKDNSRANHPSAGKPISLPPTSPGSETQTA